MTSFFCDRIVIDHGIHISGGDEEGETGLAEDTDTFGIPVVRLCDDPGAVAVGFEQPAEDGRTEGGMVYIGVS